MAEISILGVWVLDISDAVKFVHKNLKVVQFEGYIGSQVENEFLRAVMMSGPLIQKVVIYTELNYSEHS